MPSRTLPRQIRRTFDADREATKLWSIVAMPQQKASGGLYAGDVAHVP
ncbi:MAG: hypothetical protein ACR2MC_04685 [Actinomycetota bacterium]